MKREQKKNIEQLEKVMEENKKLPKSVREKMNSKVFENMVIAAIIMIYLAALNIGMNNIPTDMYRTDLKVFSLLLLITAIMIFEYGYKKDNRRNMATRSRGYGNWYIYFILDTFIFYVLCNL